MREVQLALIIHLEKGEVHDPRKRKFFTVDEIETISTVESHFITDLRDTVCITEDKHEGVSFRKSSCCLEFL